MGQRECGNVVFLQSVFTKGGRGKGCVNVGENVGCEKGVKSESVIPRSCYVNGGVKLPRRFGVCKSEGCGFLVFMGVVM